MICQGQGTVRIVMGTQFPHERASLTAWHEANVPYPSLRHGNDVNGPMNAGSPCLCGAMKNRRGDMPSVLVLLWSVNATEFFVHDAWQDRQKLAYKLWQQKGCNTSCRRPIRAAREQAMYDMYTYSTRASVGNIRGKKGYALIRIYGVPVLL